MVLLSRGKWTVALPDKFPHAPMVCLIKLIEDLDICPKKVNCCLGFEAIQASGELSA
jgi:hypothetical protein